MTKTNKDDDEATQSSGLINNQPDPDKTSKQEDHQFSNADMADRTLATVTREDERSVDDVGHHPDQPPEEIDTWIHSPRPTVELRPTCRCSSCRCSMLCKNRCIARTRTISDAMSKSIKLSLSDIATILSVVIMVLLPSIVVHCLEVFVKQERSIREFAAIVNDEHWAA